MTNEEIFRKEFPVLLEAHGTIQTHFELGHYIRLLGGMFVPWLGMEIDWSNEPEVLAYKKAQDELLKRVGGRIERSEFWEDEFWFVVDDVRIDLGEFYIEA